MTGMHTPWASPSRYRPFPPPPPSSPRTPKEAGERERDREGRKREKRCCCCGGAAMTEGARCVPEDREPILGSACERECRWWPERHKKRRRTRKRRTRWRSLDQLGGAREWHRCREALEGGGLVYDVMRMAFDGGGHGGLEEDSGGALRRERWLNDKGGSHNVVRRTL